MINSSVQRITFRRFAIVLLSLLPCLCLFQQALAGGGPENVAVIVNGNSNFSMTVANHYISWRKIPSSNVIVLDEIQEGGVIEVDDFREKILKPVLSEIANRRLQRQIDYIVYSADFPTAVNVRSDIKKLGIELGKIYTPVASINGLTYLFMYTLQGDARYIHMEANRYYALNAEETLRSGKTTETVERFDEAIKNFEEEEYEASLKIFKELSGERPELASLHIWIASCHASLKQLRPAQAAIDKTVELGWEDSSSLRLSPALLNLGNQLDYSKLPTWYDELPRNTRLSRSFEADHKWSDNHLVVEESATGFHYFISSVLAVTENDFISQQESLDALKLAIDADMSDPSGRFYFSLTKDVRTTTRKPGFAEAITELQRLGYESQIVDGPLPKNQIDVLGLTMGKASFDWKGSGSSIVPGAYCDNLTSFGGIFHHNRSNQTRLTELLKNGAAASSGTVTEPYALQNKFTLPYVHVHYVRGCSLGEAFYQSLFAPYQLLLVGDPLCQPFATAPALEIEPSQSASLPWKGVVEIKVKVPDAVTALELYADGRLAATEEPDVNNLRLDTTTLPDGYHEFRVVAVGEAPIHTRKSIAVPVTVSNNGLECVIKLDQAELASDSSTVTGTVRSEGASQIVIQHGMRVLQTISGDSGKVEIPVETLGKGPIELIAVANHADQKIQSPPALLNVAFE